MELKDIFKYMGHFSKDTRTVSPGDVYIALTGECHDGHDFVADALAKGADYAIVSRDVEGVPAEKLVMVPDTLEALVEIARYSRRNMKGKVVAVTGSSGKTSTKEMLKVALGVDKKVYATAGNLNNHIGLPLTLANMPVDTDIVILEMGMNHTGEIAHLTDIAQPDVVVITNIGNAHHEFFPSKKEIAQAKAEIFRGLTKNGWAFIHNDDEDVLDILLSEARKYTVNIKTFGKKYGSDIQLLKYDSSSVEVSVSGNAYSYSMKMLGEHQAMNSIVVLGVVSVLGGNIHKAVQAVSEMLPLDGRGAVSEVDFDGKRITLINDAYNANPDSMKAALKVLGGFKDRRRVAIIGDMRELGNRAREMHASLLDTIIAVDIDKVLAVGENMRYLYKDIPIDRQGHWTLVSRDMLPLLHSLILQDDVVLVKGSLGTNMLLVIDYFNQGQER